MLDVHALAITPGAAGVLGNPGTVAVNDGCPTAGVPLNSQQKLALLRMWGVHAPTADTINNIKLYSQDMIDPVNGVNYVMGAASLLVQFYDYTKLLYDTGARFITCGTNTGVVAGTAYLIDEYPAGWGGTDCRNLGPAFGNEVVTGATTFGGALTTNQWGSVAYAPTNALPQGKYAILGAFVTSITNVALIRFSHADFKGLKPGFMVCNSELGLVTTEQVAMRDDLVRVANGEQFVYLSKELESPCCPVFNVGPGATGLTIEMISVQADTPVVNLVLMKVS